MLYHSSIKMPEVEKIHTIRNVTVVRSPRSRKTSTVTFIPPKIRKYFDIENGDELIWNVMGDNIIINVVKKSKSISDPKTN